MYGVYCIRNDHHRPVLAAENLVYETAQQIEQDIAERVRLAKALEDKGNKYLQGVISMYISDGENETDQILLYEEPEEK